jgi:hypothetical protein
MSTIETIQEKIQRLPSAAQEEVLEAVRQIELRYQEKDSAAGQNGEAEAVHPLTLLASIRIDAPPDFAERHDFYAHGKLED